MGARPSNNPYGSGAETVDKLIGTAYDVVRLVSENIVYVTHLSLNMEHVIEGNANIAEIRSVSEHLDRVLSVADNITGLMSLDEKSNELLGLYAELTKLLQLYANLTKILNVANSLDDITLVLSNMNKIEIMIGVLPDLLEVIDQKDAILTAIAQSESHAANSANYASAADAARQASLNAATTAGQNAATAGTAANQSGTYAGNAFASAQSAQQALAQSITIRDNVTNIRDNLLANLSAVATGVPNGQPAKATYNPTTKTITFEIPAGASGAGTGDMLKTVYDPDGKNASAFSMGNMTETSGAKVMTAAERTKLAGLSAVATTGSYSDLINKPTLKDGTVTSVGITPPTGMKASADITVAGKIVLDFLAGFSLLTDAQSNKLSGIAAAATANATDAQLRDRSTHTGSQSISTVSGLTQALADSEKLANKGQANGYAGLDANGKVPLAQMNEAVLGGMNYKDVWNAATNTPAIPAANAANKGHYYVVNVAGETNVSGITDWKVGDWIVSNGTKWDKIDSTDQVTSVNGKQGNVVLSKNDVGLSNVDNTRDQDKPVSDPQAEALNTKLSVLLNFSDLTDKPAARTNLGLGNSATRDVGTGANTVAAGNDTRLVNAGLLNVEDQIITGGARVASKDLGTITTGTLTLDAGDRPLQHYVNNGAHTLAPSVEGGSFMVDITNGASAGAITLSGWTKVTGDTFTVTSGHKFRVHCSTGMAGTLLVVQAMQ